MILLIDNYDSFVFNLARYVKELGGWCDVVRNDAITIDEIAHLSPSHIILSPGPCTPNEAGISIDIVIKLGSRFPILGICLGHQAIAQAYGGTITRAVNPMHGKSANVRHDTLGLFKNLKNPLRVGRYHSLIVSDKNLPDELLVCARSEDHEIMAIRHRYLPVYGFQFHPESVLTEHGYDMMERFLEM